MTTIALVDDHILLRQGLASLINTFDNYQVIFEADNGKQFIDKLNESKPPVAVLMDINMPVMNGFETVTWLKKNHPAIKILALSMSDEEEVILNMLQCGANGYILKNSTPEELKHALDTVMHKGYYINDLVGNNLFASLNKPADEKEAVDISVLNEREMEFIKLSCTELSYNEIAEQMHLSPKTMDFYKSNIEKKLGIKSRVSLVKFAAKHGIIKL